MSKSLAYWLYRAFIYENVYETLDSSVAEQIIIRISQIPKGGVL